MTQHDLFGAVRPAPSPPTARPPAVLNREGGIVVCGVEVSIEDLTRDLNTLYDAATTPLPRPPLKRVYGVTARAVVEQAMRFDQLRARAIWVRDVLG